MRKGNRKEEEGETISGKGGDGETYIRLISLLPSPRIWKSPSRNSGR